MTHSGGDRADPSSSQPTASPSSGSGVTASPRKQTRFTLYTPEHVMPRSKLSQSEDVAHRRWKKPSAPRGSTSKSRIPSENTPLLRSSSGTNRMPSQEDIEPSPAPKKPFYRARPLWYVLC